MSRKAVQNVLHLLSFLRLVQREHGAFVGVVELLQIGPFLLLVQERERNDLDVVIRFGQDFRKDGQLLGQYGVLQVLCCGLCDLCPLTEAAFL